MSVVYNNTTSSRTITLPPEELPVASTSSGVTLTLLVQTIQVRGVLLLNQMKASGRFSGQLNVWEATFLPRLANVSTQGDQFAVAQALGFFLFEVIRPVECGGVFEKELRQIVKDTLPVGIPVDMFLDEIEKVFREEALLRQKAIHLEAWARVQREKIYAAANVTNEKIAAEYDRVIARLREVVAARKMNVGAVRRELDALTTQVAQVQQRLLLSANQAQDLSCQFKAQETTCSKLASHAFIFKKV